MTDIIHPGKCEADKCVRASRNISNVVRDGRYQRDSRGRLTHFECKEK